nr:gag pol polyprotein [Hymenolepis microstoma]
MGIKAITEGYDQALVRNYVESSPDLAPNDYHLFRSMRLNLNEKNAEEQPLTALRFRPTTHLVTLFFFDQPSTLRSLAPTPLKMSPSGCLQIRSRASRFMFCAIENDAVCIYAAAKKLLRPAQVEKRLQQLFSQIELGDHSPSHLLSHMCSLACGLELNDKILMELWVNSYQDDLDRLAEVSDRIHNHHDRPSVNAVKTSAAADTVTQRLDAPSRWFT